MATRMLLLGAGALLATVSHSLTAQIPEAKLWQPGLGEYMEGIQRHHAALFFAGQTGNWELASFELKEIEEGIGDARTFVPVHEGVNVKELFETVVPPGTKGVHASIEKGDKQLFGESFKVLTAACNACHTAAKVPFIEIIEPTGMPTVNQRYTKR
jgi:cytochrome c1